MKKPKGTALIHPLNVPYLSPLRHKPKLDLSFSLCSNVLALVLNNYSLTEFAI